MKFYSEVTNKIYNSVEDLNTAEAAERAKQDKKAKENQEKENRRKVVEAALVASRKARKDYEKIAEEFEKDYGHPWTMNSVDKNKNNCSYGDSFNTLFDLIFGAKPED